MYIVFAELLLWASLRFVLILTLATLQGIYFALFSAFIKQFRIPFRLDIHFCVFFTANRYG